MKTANASILVLFVSTRCIILFSVSPLNSDVFVYENYSKQFSQGLTVYRDFLFEYPPLAYVLIILPWIIEPGFGYVVTFRLMCAAADWLIVCLMMRAGNDRTYKTAAYLTCTTFLGSLLYERLDIFLGLCFTVTWYLRRQGRYAWSYGILGIGTALKLFPAVVVPWLLVYDGVRRRALVANCIGFVAPLLLLTLAFASYSGWACLSFLAYHWERGIEIESTLASVLFCCMEFGLTVSSYCSHGSINVTSGIDACLVVTSVGALILAYLAGVALIHRNAATVERSSATELDMLLVALAIALCMVLSKVFTPQYMVWMALVVIFASCRSDWLWTFVLLPVLCGLTSLISTSLWEELTYLQGHARLTAALRNSGVVLLTVRLGFVLFERVRSPAHGRAERPRDIKARE